MLVLSLALGLVHFDPERVLALRRIGGATFKAPVRIGDTICVEGRVAALRPLDPATGLVETAMTVVNQDGRTVAVIAVAVLWRRAGES